MNLLDKPVPYVRDRYDNVLAAEAAALGYSPEPVPVFEPPVLPLETTGRGTLQIVLNDERTESRWECDPVLEAGKLQHVAVIVDGGPKVISFVIDGVLNDGGEDRQFGWGRFNPQFRNVPGADVIKIGPIMDGRIERLRIYDRYLRTSEVIANYRAGL